MSEKFKALIIDNQKEKFTREIKEVDNAFFKDGNVGVCIVISSIFMKEIKLCAKHINKMAQVKKITLQKN